MIRTLFYFLGFSTELWALWHAGSSRSYEEGAYWMALAIYVSIVAVAARQIANGHTFFTEKDKT